MIGHSLTLALFSMVALCVPAPGHAAASRAAEADSLHTHAIAVLAGGGIEARIQAMRELDTATRLDPTRAEVWRDLARLCLSSGQLTRSRGCLERVEALRGDDAEATLGLARSWNWDWLTTLDLESRGRAVQWFLAAAKTDPRSLEPRLSLAGLAVSEGDIEFALRAAWSAIQAAPEAPEALLALGLASYRTGDLARADSAFHTAIPRLEPAVRARFADFSMLGVGARPGAAGTVAASADGHPVSAFWDGRDPDLTTPENEIELDFLSRVAHAILLFRDSHGRARWDTRAEMFVRYGLPARFELNPAEESIGEKEIEMSYRRLASLAYAPDPLGYPYDLQVWVYPELGLRIKLWDQSLQQEYQLPVAYDTDPGPRARVASGSDLEVVGDGRGAFHTFPPGTQLLPARGAIARFPSATGARLVAHLEVPGGPADTLRGAWAVVAADGRVAARGATALVVSSCAPGERRTASFDAEVPPGDYRVDLSVVGNRGRRGRVRTEARVAAPAGGLALSDLVLLCGPALPASRDAIRIEPDLDRRAGRARTIVLYFEIDGLTVDAGNGSRFAYRYAVRPMKDKKRPEPEVEATREEEHVGRLRRQFVSIPLAGIRRGGYEVEIEVRDLASGATATATTRFEKE